MEFTLVRGVNLTGMFEETETPGNRSGTAGPQPLSRFDIERLADMGFDHLRILIARNPFSGTGDQKEADRLFELLSWCNDVSLKVVVVPGEPGVETGQEQDLLGYWTDLSSALREYSEEMVGYGISDQRESGSAESWNEQCAVLIAMIREHEPHRPLVVEAAGAGNVENLPLLHLPAVEDLMICFRYYRPLLVTHYGISGSPDRLYQGPVHYPGAPITDRDFSAIEAERQQTLRSMNIYRDRYVIAEELENALENRQRKDVPVYCGEFGCSRELPTEVRELWLHDIVSVLDRLHIGWAIREYHGPFGVFDSEEDGSDLLPVLMNSSYRT